MADSAQVARSPSFRRLANKFALTVALSLPFAAGGMAHAQSMPTSHILKYGEQISVADREAVQKIRDNVNLGDVIALNGNTNPQSGKTYDVDIKWVERNWDNSFNQAREGRVLEAIIVAFQHKEGLHHENGKLDLETRRALGDTVGVTQRQRASISEQQGHSISTGTALNSPVVLRDQQNYQKVPETVVPPPEPLIPQVSTPAGGSSGAGAPPAPPPPEEEPLSTNIMLVNANPHPSTTVFSNTQGTNLQAQPKIPTTASTPSIPLSPAPSAASSTNASGVLSTDTVNQIINNANNLNAGISLLSAGEIQSTTGINPTSNTPNKESHAVKPISIPFKNKAATPWPVQLTTPIPSSEGRSFYSDLSPNKRAYPTNNHYITIQNDNINSTIAALTGKLKAEQDQFDILKSEPEVTSDDLQDLSQRGIRDEIA